MFAKLIETLKANPRTLVFTEGSDARILEATARLKKDGFLTPILVGVETEVKAAAEKGGFDIEGVRIVDPATYAGMDAMVEKMVELRKGKMTPEDCRKNLMKGNYFGTMLVKMGEADCLLGGATYSTADTVRPALQLIKTKPGNSNVSSCFILQREKDGVDERLCMGDCAIQIDPDEDALVETALECAKTAATFGIDPKIAFLSYSTKGSGKGDAVDKVKNACDKAKAAAPELATTARCSSTPLCPRWWGSRSSPAPRWPATPIPLSSRRFSPATLAIRLPSAWAASPPTAPFSRA